MTGAELEGSPAPGGSRGVGEVEGEGGGGGGGEPEREMKIGIDAPGDTFPVCQIRKY